MAVLNHFECKTHGIFESFEKKCPYGCSKSFVSLIFLQAPATKSRRTKGIDKELRNLADDYNLPDIRNDKDGTSTMTKLGRTGKGTQWVDVPHGKPGSPAKFDIASFGADPGATPGLRPGMFQPPKPILTR